ncbi:MAG: hypothetical protein IJ417_05425 [Bacteroidaceae bacterium]|nr:hypothetical protein [Bacteroidaceae bacterium]
MKNKKLNGILLAVGALLILTGSAFFITGWTLAPYVYSIGAVLFAVMQFLGRYKGDDWMERRLSRQQLLGALFLLVTGVLMFVERHNSWVVTLTIAAVFELYTAFRMKS